MRRTTQRPPATQPPTVDHRAVRKIMVAVREAFRHHREARRERQLYSFYVEHSLHDQADSSRRLTLGLLRDARQHWRTALGL